MDLYEAIEKRRTIRIFKQGASEEQLRRIILAGTRAPSAANCQPWEFIIIDDPKIIDQLAELKYRLNLGLPKRPGDGPRDVEIRALNQKKWFQNASVIAVCTRKGLSPSAAESESVWACIQNMSLAAMAEGLGSNIVTYWGSHEREAAKLLGLPEGYKLETILKVGAPGERGFSPDHNPAAPRRPDFSWLHRNRF